MGLLETVGFFTNRCCSFFPSRVKHLVGDLFYSKFKWMDLRGQSFGSPCGGKVTPRRQCELSLARSSIEWPGSQEKICTARWIGVIPIFVASNGDKHSMIAPSFTVLSSDPVPSSATSISSTCLKPRQASVAISSALGLLPRCLIEMQLLTSR